ncbi:MAG: AI-2E family transporter [Sphaerochaetaceae bacterium]|nr:AI-2E family transporter [Sphaerochaetaceae bacterium]
MDNERIEKNYGKQLRNILIILAILAIFATLKITSSISIRVLLAMFIFIMVLPITDYLEKSHVPSFIATLIAVFLIFIVITGAIWFLIFTVNTLIKTVPGYAPRIFLLDQFLVNFLRRWFEDLPSDASILGNLNIDWIGGVAMPLLKSVSSSTLNIVKDGMITLLMAIFLLLERHTIIPKLIYMVSPDNESRVNNMWGRLNHQVSKYIILKLIISGATGICFYFVAKISGMDLAFLWGVLAFIMNFIPTIGSIIVTAITIFMAMLQFVPNWGPILTVAIGTVMTQMIIGNIIDPRIQGGQLNLSPFVILVSLEIFGYIWGIIGMFLAVPLLSIIQIVLANIEETRPVAVMLSTGRNFRTETATKEKKRVRKNWGQKKYNEDPANFNDIMFPEDRPY